MKNYKDINLGYIDAVNYRKRENKELFNKIFVKDTFLDQICRGDIYFLIGEKGTGKTAYSIYLTNNGYLNNVASTRFVRETEYIKFMKMKNANQLDLSDFVSIWKVIIYVLLFEQLNEKEGLISKLKNIKRFNALKDTVDEFYAGAFSPEITTAISFAENSKEAAEIMFKHFKIQGMEEKSYTFTEQRYQTNLLYLQRKFESVFEDIKLSKSHILFIDGIDIRPANIPFAEYLDCVKGLANAIWEINNDIFPKIKDSTGRIRVVLLLRPDIFSSLSLQNQNPKFSENSVFLDWRTEYVSYKNSEIFKIFDNLFSSQQSNTDNLAQGESWGHYFPWDAPNLYDDYNGQPTSFINFLRWSYYRPRDILEMLILLQKNSSNFEVITLQDFENPAFQRDYSNYLLGEIKDHLLFYYIVHQNMIFF